MKSNSILLSIKPIYAHKIFNGEKTIELRRKRPKNLRKGDLVVVYVSSPQKNIFGIFTVKKIIEDSPNKLWQKIIKKACVTKNEFDEYFGSLGTGYGIVIDNYCSFPKPISLEEIKSLDASFNIPQSYRYLKESDFNLMQAEFGVTLGIA
ncbi:MAG: ASCH domain-containing protein [Ignavibacteriae bacterium]|nr:ASCH domain-containing protein [Ignavibacteriota bacterium]